MTEDLPSFAPEEGLTPISKTKKLGRKLVKFILLMLVFLTVGAFFSYRLMLNLNEPPSTFPVDQSIVIESGTDVQSIANQLEGLSVVKSADFLYYIISFFHESTNIKASTYVFSEPISAWSVAVQLTKGDFNTDLIRFTHFEGERATQIAAQAASVLSDFDTEVFVLTAEPWEGKLFPDTYFIPADYSAEELLDLLVDTFTEKTTSLQSDIEDHPLTLDEILVLASIIEREANGFESMQAVSSILQNRIELGMPLQADASIEYVLNKPLSELTPEDLKIDSPYNTYLNLGLPPTPIGNPGLGAIKAVLGPVESDYFYYITDNEGEFHYAETYRQHLVNIERYLR